MCKSFGGTRALVDVDFELRAGEVHVLAGENGAGKSTLMKLLGGVYAADAGEMCIAGRVVRFRSPRDAGRHGVAVIHQELSLVPTLSAAENVCLGRERATLGWVRRREQARIATEALAQLGVRLDVRQAAEQLSLALQQLVEIARALASRARILVMDEPTSALREPEVERLMASVAALRGGGCGVVYITHRMEEVYRVADRITVLRDGRRVATATAAELPAEVLVSKMLGREGQAGLRDTTPAAKRAGLAGAPGGRESRVRLRVADLRVESSRRGGVELVRGVSFEVRAGEVLGLAGLEGSGTSAALWAAFGAWRGRVSGEVEVDGQRLRGHRERAAIRAGVALVTSDRQRSGLVPHMSVAENLTLASLGRISRYGWLSGAAERAAYEEIRGRLNLRAASAAQPVATLSGGNQQKVVLGKWIRTEPGVLLLDEPTRGVDIGTKQDIYELLGVWRAEGRAIVLTTSELPELLMLSDRILVFYRGRVAAELSGPQATAEAVLHAAMGGEAA